MEICRGCGDEFEAKAYQIAKRDLQCKACRRQYGIARRARLRALGRTRKNTQRDLDRAKAWRAANGHRPDVRAAYQAYRKVYRSSPEERAKDNVRQKVKYAVKKGRLVRKPCERCGKTKVEAHHEDYSKPLDVVWLCRLCHEEAHHRRRAA